MNGNLIKRNAIKIAKLRIKRFEWANFREKICWKETKAESKEKMREKTNCILSKSSDLIVQPTIITIIQTNLTICHLKIINFQLFNHQPPLIFAWNIKHYTKNSVMSFFMSQLSKYILFSSYFEWHLHPLLIIYKLKSVSFSYFSCFILT